MPLLLSGPAMPHAPLAGLRVLVTRPASDGADDWAAALAAAGAKPIPYPTIVIEPPPSWQPLDEALARLGDYDWVIFTSQTAVALVLGRLPGGSFPPDMRAKLAAVGPSTARSIEAAGGAVSLVPADNRQEGLAEALRSFPEGTRVLFPAAAGARTQLAESLRARGCVVDVVTAYRAQPRADLGPPPPFDVATFASPSALNAYVAHVGRESLAGKTVAVIGPVTAKEAVERGIKPAIARRPDVAALILAITESRSARGDT